MMSAESKSTDPEGKTRASPARVSAEHALLVVTAYALGFVIVSTGLIRARDIA